MVLENFLVDADILWDRAGKELYEKPEARAGRKMRVRVTNRGVIEDLTGFTLNLGWTSTKDETKFGLDAFDVVDATKGLYELDYTSGMLTNIGTLKAALQLVPTVGNTVESNNFAITVTRSAVDATAVQSETSFTALALALVDVNAWNTTIDGKVIDWEADMAATKQTYIDTLNATEAAYPQELNSLSQQLADTGTNARIFNFVGDGITDDAIPFTNMINSNYPTILFPPNGRYKITDSIVNNSGINKKILFNNSTIVIDFATTKNFIHFFKNVALHDVTLDFNNNHCGHGLFYEEDLGKITLKNVKIKNIYDRTLAQTMVIYVKSSGNSLDFDGVTLDNLKKYGDGTETTLFEGIYVAPYATQKVISGGKLSNININEFHRVDVNGTIIKDISNAIYLSSGSASNKEYNVVIENLKGYNFGKRLLKSQVSAITVRDVYAESNTDDAMTGLSFQDLDTVRTHNVVAENIILRGKMRFGVNITADNTTIDNLNIDIQPATLFSTSSIGLSLGGDDCTIGTGSVKATIPVLGNRAKSIGRGRVKNIKIGKVKLMPQTNSTNTSPILDWTSTDNEPFDGLTLSGTIIERTGDKCGLGLNLGNSTDESYNLVLDKVVINDNFDTENTNYGGTLQKITGVKYRDVTHNNIGLGSLFRSFNHTNCKNINIENMDCNAKAQLTANSFSACTDVSVKALKGSALTTYLGSFSNTDTIIQSSDMSKMIFNDLFSIQNRKYVKKQTFGTTDQRPPSPSVTDEHYDITLSKPIYWNGTSWVDATGTAV